MVILLRVIALPLVAHQLVIARRERLQLLVVALFVKPGLLRQIIAMQARVHLEQLDIARPGQTQELRAREGRPQFRAPTGSAGSA